MSGYAKYRGQSVGRLIHWLTELGFPNVCYTYFGNGKVWSNPEAKPGQEIATVSYDEYDTPFFEWYPNYSHFSAQYEKRKDLILEEERDYLLSSLEEEERQFLEKFPEEYASVRHALRSDLSSLGVSRLEDRGILSIEKSNETYAHSRGFVADYKITLSPEAKLLAKNGFRLRFLRDKKDETS